jgi:hypothetical protein
MEWAALRKVNRIDGLKVKETAPKFEDAFEDSPEANARRLQDMKKESTEYNLGDVQREINLPTFAQSPAESQSVALLVRALGHGKDRRRCRRGKSAFGKKEEADRSWSAPRESGLFRTGRCGSSRHRTRSSNRVRSGESVYPVSVKGRTTVTYGAGKIS